MEMCKKLPIEELVCMVFEKFEMFDILVLMQEDAMNQFIMEPDVERKYSQKSLAKCPLDFIKYSRISLSSLKNQVSIP